MSTFTMPIGVGNIDSREFVYVDALVDTGATYSMFPRDFLEDIQVEPSWMVDFKLADGSQIARWVGPAYLQLLDREMPCAMVFGDPGVFLIGATALEIFGLAADPVNKCLVPIVVNGRPF